MERDVCATHRLRQPTTNLRLGDAPVSVFVLNVLAKQGNNFSRLPQIIH
jgi:hypothetical protein